MTSAQLPNYLLRNRKRLALSQAQVAFLLGDVTASAVSRHERFEKMPSLESVLAYEVIYQKPARDLFAGVYQKAQKQVIERGRTLTKATLEERQALGVLGENKAEESKNIS